MGAPDRGRQDRRIHRILTCWRCGGLGFQPPRIGREVCVECAGNGRLVIRPDGEIEPLEVHDEPAPREHWSANDWLFGQSPGRSSPHDEEPDWPV